MPVSYFKSVATAAVLLGLAVAGCSSNTHRGDASLVDRTAPRVVSANPDDDATDVPVNQSITVVFSKQMDGATFNPYTFTLTQSAFSRVEGTVTYEGMSAKFTPAARLNHHRKYYAKIRASVRDLAGNTMTEDVVWGFRTGGEAAKPQQGVNLGAAGMFIVLAETGISNTGTTSVRGDVGLSPGEGSQFTGFANTMDASNQYATSAHVSGRMYAAEYAPPTPVNVVKAVRDMNAAYTDAAGRTMPHAKDLGDGSIDRMTLAPGLYRWGSDLSIANNLVLEGGKHDIWIFQISGDLNVGNGASVTLGSGVQCNNVIWQVAGDATLGTDSEFKGILLCRKQITLMSGAVMNGRALSQRTVSLDGTTISCD